MIARRAFLALAGAAAAGVAARAAIAEWYYFTGERVLGPETLETLRSLVAQGFVRSQTRVYVAANGWRLAPAHPELADLFAAAPAPDPQEPPAGDDAAELDSFLLGTWRDENERSGVGVILDHRTVTFASGGAMSGTGQSLNGEIAFTGAWQATPLPGGKRFILMERNEIDGGPLVDRATYTIVSPDRIVADDGGVVRARQR